MIKGSTPIKHHLLGETCVLQSVSSANICSHQSQRTCTLELEEGERGGCSKLNELYVWLAKCTLKVLLTIF